MATNGMGGLVGELVLSDASLSALLAEMREAVTRYGPVVEPSTKSTTGQLANDLLGVEKRHSAMLPVGLRAWLLRVKSTAEQRNAIVHAIGRDRCISCGRSSIFEHKNRPVDRSEQRIRTLIAEIEDLIDEGVKLAVELSDKLNQLSLAAAQKCAAATGEPQSPVQIRIAGTWHRCTVCSTDQQAETVVCAPAAVMVLPPGTDIRELFL
ncbi:hypothetical protein [Nocardia abscessus]|uniref:hypothetical protein n=1 Tax=Nocardia abscessus TaxID=120957 RepID=UPI0024586A4C|nr:hypothetical protein [Nocardia abscessus]